MPTTLPVPGYRPRLGYANSKRAIHLIWHTDPDGTLTYLRLTAAAPEGELKRRLETDSAGKLYGRIAVSTDDAASSDPKEDRVYAVWVDTTGEAARVMLAHSADGGVHFRIRALTPYHTSVSNIVIKTAGTHAYVVFEGDHSPGTPSRRAVWLARSHDHGRRWVVRRLASPHAPRINYNYASTRDPYEIDVAVDRTGQLVAVAFPFVEGDATDYTGGVELAFSENEGRTFEFRELQPTAPPRSVLLGSGPSYHRIRMCMDERRVLHAAWQSSVTWSELYGEAHRHTVGGMLMYRQIGLPSLSVIIPPVSALPVTHPWEAFLPDPSMAGPSGGPFQLIYLQGALESYSLAASARWTAVAYNKVPSNLSPQIEYATAGLVASGGHRVATMAWATMKSEEAYRMFSLPLPAGSDYGRGELSPIALVALPTSPDTSTFATVGVQTDISRPERPLMVCVFRAQRGRDPTGYPLAPQVVDEEVTLEVVKNNEWADAQIHSDPQNPKTLIVLWEHGVSGNRIGKTSIAISTDGGRTFR